MTAYATTHERRFVRTSDRACLAGVCSGIADFFGFRLCAVRAIFIIALFVAFPITVLTYLAIVFLVPSDSARYEYVVEREVRRRRRRRRMTRRERREAEAEEKARAAEKVRERYRSLDDRLARIERYVTSSRYDLDREFRNL